MLQKDCECGEGIVEEWKQNWDEVFINEVRREREREEKEKGVRERKEKCYKMFGDRKR
jgi:hypothetical protein